MRDTRAQLVGRKFGNLEVKAFSHMDAYRHVFWSCLCTCGNTHVTSSRQLLGGRTKSCGCRRHISGNRRKTWKGVGDLSSVYFTRTKLGASRRSLPFEITIEQCWQKFVDQAGHCALSGLPLRFATKTKDCDGTASLDRVDPTQGYTLSNIQWVHKDINVMKMDLSQARFLELVQQVAKHTAKR